MRGPRLGPAERATLVGLVCALALPEIVLQLGDAGLLGSPRWRYAAYSYGALWQGLLDNWRPNFAAQPVTMFASYGFLHVGVGHLLGNLAGLALFLPETLRRLGARGALLVYAAALLGGGLGFVLMSDSPQPMVGASGAVYGMAAAWLLWDWTDRRRARRSAGPVWAKLAVLAGANILSWWALAAALAWEAHLGGALAGVAAARWLVRRQDRRRRAAIRAARARPRDPAPSGSQAPARNLPADDRAGRP